MDLVNEANEAVEEANSRIAACEMRIARQLLLLVSQEVPGRDANAGARDRLENLLELKGVMVSYRDALLELDPGHEAMRGSSSVNDGLGQRRHGRSP
ncbi:MAG TPA: hypothetical protein VGI22_01035 [Xanthobacteraceae bacterium]|jgi:hypothetical protein